MMALFFLFEKTLSRTLLFGGIGLLAILVAACAGSSKPSLKERLATMSDADLVAYYQGVDYRLKAVGDEVRRETMDNGQEPVTPGFQQTYFLGGDGHRLLEARRVAERELERRKIPRSEWVSGPD
jgi:hypothetical protein